MGDVMEQKFSREQYVAVIAWLEQRADELRSWHMRLECGDDFAHSNGHWPRIQSLKNEETAIRHSLTTAREQLGEMSDEKISWHQDY